MAKFKRIWDASDKQYDFYDYGGAEGKYGVFTGLTGGDMTISMISYNTIGKNGGVVTKYLPGQVTYAPIRMTGSMSNEMTAFTDWFEQSVNGNFENLRRHCSIAQWQMEKDGDGKYTTRVKQLVVWELINTMPIALPGFSYNSYQKTASTSYKVLIQAEEIIITYP